MHRKKLLVASIVFGLLTMVPLAFAGNANPGVLSPSAHSYGMTYGEWSAVWWQWAVSFPATINPMLDLTGADCALGQSGPVWFLAGTPGFPATRTCTVPTGKAILFPIVNVIDDANSCPPGTPGGGQPAPGQSLEDFLRQDAATYIDPVDILEVEVDGVALHDLFNYRAPSRLFPFTGDPSLTAVFDPCITGSSQPGVSDGYWIMLAPLSAGTHTIHFKGGISSVFATEVTYHLTVLPGKP